MASLQDDAITFTKQVSFQLPPSLPALSVGNGQGNVNDPFAGDKLKHRFRERFAQAFGVDGATERRVLYWAKAAGTLTEFKATLTVAITGNDTANVDLLKNGSTVLSAAIGFTNLDAIRVLKAGSISGGSNAYVAGDVFEISITVTHNTGTYPRGLTGQAEFEESPV